MREHQHCDDRDASCPMIALPSDVARGKGAVKDAFRQVMTSPEIRSRMVTQGADPAFMGSEDFTKFLAAEMPRWEQAVKASGAKLD